MTNQINADYRYEVKGKRLVVYQGQGVTTSYTRTDLRQSIKSIEGSDLEIKPSTKEALARYKVWLNHLVAKLEAR